MIGGVDDLWPANLGVAGFAKGPSVLLLLLLVLPPLECVAVWPTSPGAREDFAGMKGFDLPGVVSRFSVGSMVGRIVRQLVAALLYTGTRRSRRAPFRHSFWARRDGLTEGKTMQTMPDQDCRFGF
jgi:hypothetical protein